MSLSLSLNIKDRATPALRAKIEALSASKLNAHIGPRLVKTTQGHFLKLPHNKRGWKPTGFWSSAARMVHWYPVPEGLVITINQVGVRQRYQGGVIRPVNKKALAIPVAEEAYGEVPAKFGDRLQLVVIPGKGAWLALKSFEATTSLGKSGRKNVHGAPADHYRQRLKFLYRLCAGIEQQGDPNVLPTDEVYYSEAIAGVKEALK